MKNNAIDKTKLTFPKSVKINNYYIKFWKTTRYIKIMCLIIEPCLARPKM